MTKGVDAGPFGTPNRWRPITWKIDSVEYSWERPVSTQQTAYSFVSQARNWLPNPIGGVYWYAVDDTYTNCYIPLYCGIEEAPIAYRTGSMKKFSWDSAWWVFNFVSNFANLKYSYMIKDIQKVQRELENEEFELQSAIEKTALELYQKSPEKAKSFLTDYSLGRADKVVKRWKELGEFLIMKYNDGYIHDENGRIKSVGYPESWLRDVIKLRGEHFKLPMWKTDGK